MSTYLHLTNFDIVTEVYKRQQEAELFREKEFRAALRVQAWWRGAQLRSYMKFLHRSATVIQVSGIIPFVFRYWKAAQRFFERKVRN